MHTVYVNVCIKHIYSDLFWLARGIAIALLTHSLQRKTVEPVNIEHFIYFSSTQDNQNRKHSVVTEIGI